MAKKILATISSIDAQLKVMFLFLSLCTNDRFTGSTVLKSCSFYKLCQIGLTRFCLLVSRPFFIMSDLEVKGLNIGSHLLYVYAFSHFCFTLQSKERSRL
ncbi:hypothetical protein HanHA300_Chr13g0495941 [Helianthus annuus]|nr:hypothetical protein HanHA300_Chr13g0495941 [Helianthus annuus]KAJ0498941.1 hypothetical protein HanHA89_Chr13g0528581 [Helianthus annuus]KAJ0664956.1 hypothetical protein HanLR1_Chr13g0498611 [Helianthus annuus]KAJ0672376.1 hypothetical protein HanOQP8_Chr13g0496581 [Helianthus annuus]